MNIKSTRKRNFFLALIMMVAGMLPLSVAVGILEPQEGTVHAPMWVLGLCGLVFVTGGFILVLGQNSGLKDLLAAVICFGFGSVGLWVALYGSSEGFSGGIPLIPDEINLKIARWVFGIFSVISYTISAYAVLRFFR